MTDMHVEEFTANDGALYRISAVPVGGADDMWVVRCAHIDEPGGSAERVVRDSIVSGRDEAVSIAELWQREVAGA